MKKKVKKASKNSVKHKHIVKKNSKKKVPKKAVKKQNNQLKKAKKNSKKSAKKSRGFRIRKKVNVPDQRLKVQKQFVKKGILDEPQKVVEEEKKPGNLKYDSEYKTQFDEKFIKNYYKNLILRSHELISKRRGVFQKTIWLDLLFFFILFVLFRATAIFILKNFSFEMDMFQLPFAFTMTVLLFLLGLFAYSIIKYRILTMIEALLEDVRLNIDRFDKFFILNCLTIGSVLLLFFITYIISYFSGPFIALLVWAVFALVLVLSYSFVNISHWLYAHEPRFRKTVRRTLMIMASGFSKYIGLSSIILGILSLYSLIACGIGSLLEGLEIDIGMYKNIALGIGIVIFYTSLAYSRISFFFAVNKLKNEIKD